MSEEEAALQPVKLKISYTFDAEHKIDHLSKPPNSIVVQTAQLDETTIIGVVSLRQCLDPVIASSPELVSSDNEFTVYAYDYSETNTPLVGQGLLSKVLSHDPADSEAMVTGRLTPNVMAKFNKNAHPMLEVKLRFTPVTTGFRQRSGSMSSVSSAYQQQYLGSQNSSFERAQSPVELSRYDSVQRMLSEGAPRRDSSVPYNSMSRPTSRPSTPSQTLPYTLPPNPGSTHSRNGSYAFQHYRHDSNARRDSHAGYFSGEEAFEEPARKRAKIAQVSKISKKDLNIERQPNTLHQVATNASSLRLHQPQPRPAHARLQESASRDLEAVGRAPTPIPNAKGTFSKNGKPMGRPRKRPPRSKSQLGRMRDSSPVSDAGSLGGLADSEMSSPEESRNAASHETPTTTPIEMPSSPPIVRHEQSLSPLKHSIEPQFADSIFPPEVNIEDDLFGEMDFDDYFLNNPLPNQTMDNLPSVFEDDSTVGGPTPAAEPTPQPQPSPMPYPNAEVNQSLRPHQQIKVLTSPAQDFGALSVFAFSPPASLSGQNTGAPMDQLAMPPPAVPSQFSPQPFPDPHTQNAHRSSSTPSLQPLPVPKLQPSTTNRNGKPAPMLLPRPDVPHLARSQSTIPPVPASDPGWGHLERSNTWTGNSNSGQIMSDAQEPNQNGKKVRKRGKEQTQARLEQAIANGAMPPFCHNCGTIETPAWRRGLVKHFTCPIDSIETSLDPKEMCYKEPIEFNSDGSCKVWRGFKVDKAQPDADSGWEQICMCNPCGIWFHKNKYPRPASKWQKPVEKEKKKRKRPPKPPKSRAQPPRGQGGIDSDAIDPQSDHTSGETPGEDGEEGEEDGGEGVETTNEEVVQDKESKLPPIHMRSAQTARRTVMFAANARQIQSSPLKKGFTVEDPIDIELTPKPTRRVLFPSPNGGSGNVKVRSPLQFVEDALVPSFVRRSPRINKTRDMIETTSIAVAVSLDGEGKENITPPQQVMLDDFVDLFGEAGIDFQAPVTPTPKRRSERIALRTPGRTPGREIDTNSRRTPKSQKTAQQDDFGNFDDFFNESAMKRMAAFDVNTLSPGSRSLFADLDKTPGRTPGGSKTKKTIPNFDFADLPKLNLSSPFLKDMHHGNGAVPTSELPTEHLLPPELAYQDEISTDRVMPSSPPTWENSRSQPSLNTGVTSDFGQFTIDGIDLNSIDWSNVEDIAGAFETPKKQGGDLLEVKTPRSLRRSPRKAGHE